MIVRFFFCFFLISWFHLGFAQLPIKIPKPPDHKELLQDILSSRKSIQPISSARREDIRVLGFTQDEKKILFLKKITVNQKLQQDLILFDSTLKETHHYRFNNPLFYNRKKRKLIAQYEFITRPMVGTALESEMINHPFLPADLLFVREDGITTIGSQPLVPSLQILLNNGRERYLLGKIKFLDFSVTSIKAETMYLSSEGRIAAFVLTLITQKQNIIEEKKDIIGFDLYRVIMDPMRKITAKNNFFLSPEQAALPFQRNFYYNERDELLYQETLYQSGLRKIEGKGVDLY